MADNKDGTDELPVPAASDDRRLSIPNSVQRRKFGSLGTYNRAVVCAVDPSDRAKAAFLCTSYVACLIHMPELLREDRLRFSAL